jgi:hypothetical protein
LDDLEENKIYRKLRRRRRTRSHPAQNAPWKRLMDLSK